MSDALTRADGAVEAMFPAMSVSRRARLIRAVLEAVREPDTSMTGAGAGAEHIERAVHRGRYEEHIGEIFTAMIDALIIQDPNIPVVGKLVMDSEGPYTKQLRGEAERQLNDSATGEVTESPWWESKSLPGTMGRQIKQMFDTEEEYDDWLAEQ